MIGGRNLDSSLDRIAPSAGLKEELERIDESLRKSADSNLTQLVLNCTVARFSKMFDIAIEGKTFFFEVKESLTLSVQKISSNLFDLDTKT